MKWIKQTLAALFLIGVLVSCEYEFVEIATPQPPDPGDTTTPVDTIHFAAQIEPIFVSSNCTNCHSGGLALDLRTGFAYASIFANNVVTPGDPTVSKLYTYPHPVSGTHNTKYATVDDANLIYSWIAQGALDN